MYGGLEGIWVVGFDDGGRCCSVGKIGEGGVPKRRLLLICHLDVEQVSVLLLNQRDQGRWSWLGRLDTLTCRLWIGFHMRLKFLLLD